MQVGVEHKDDYSILNLKGEFDSFYCKPFLAKMDELFEDGVQNVVLNLLRVQFINSTALGTLVKTSKACGSRGGKLVISAPSAFCRQVIETVGLNRVLPLFDTDAEAEQHLLGMVEKPTVDGGNLLEEEESAVLFSPVDESVVEPFIPQSKRTAAANPVHGHAFGSSWRGVGRMAALTEDSVAFTWDGGNTGLSTRQMAEMLKPGLDMKIKFRLPLMQRQLSEAIVTIQGVEEREGGVKLKADFTEIQAKVLEAVQQYVKDIKYLKTELKDATDGDAKGA